MATATERQEILTDLSTVAISDLVALWRRASLVDTDFAELMVAAFPELAASYSEVATSMAAGWYTESAAAAALSYEAIPAAVKPIEALAQSAQWALGAEGEQALSRMSGSLQRSIFDGARDTIVLNVENTGSRWVRHARPDACAFCRMLATRHKSRRAWYRSTESALGATRYHDHCRCTAVEIHVGQEYDPPSYVQAWDDEYQKARANAGKSDLKSILSAWREQGAR